MIVMDYTKHIRKSYKKREGAPLRLGPGGCLPFCGPEMQGGRAAPPGLAVLSVAARGRGDGLPGMSAAGNVPAAICGGNSAVFNQPLTTFLVIAMVWWLSVFFLCSYRQFRRGWGLFRSPGAGRWWSVPGVVWGCWLLAVGSGNGRGSGKRDGASQDGGRVLPHILPTPPRTLGWRKTGRVVLWNPCRKLSGTCSRLFKISSFYSACFERNLWYFENRQNYTNPCSEVFTMPCKKKKGGRKGC